VHSALQRARVECDLIDRRRWHLLRGFAVELPEIVGDLTQQPLHMLLRDAYEDPHRGVLLLQPRDLVDQGPALPLERFQ
jgi:hypothetical protein